MDVLQGICGAAVETGGQVDVTRVARDVTASEPGQREVARRAEPVEGALGRVDPVDRERVVALGRE